MFNFIKKSGIKKFENRSLTQDVKDNLFYSERGYLIAPYFLKHKTYENFYLAGHKIYYYGALALTIPLPFDLESVGEKEFEKYLKSLIKKLT